MIDTHTRMLLMVVSKLIGKMDGKHTCACYVAVIEDDVNVLEARGGRRFDKACSEERAEETLGGVGEGEEEDARDVRIG